MNPLWRQRQDGCIEFGDVDGMTRPISTSVDIWDRSASSVHPAGQMSRTQDGEPPGRTGFAGHTVMAAAPFARIHRQMMSPSLGSGPSVASTW
jgi:hypothetical protein